MSSAACTECGRLHDLLFSNRPLHKGLEPTLLLCPDCAIIAQRSARIEADTVQCQWCGALGQWGATPAGRPVCEHCTALCGEIASTH